jgi:hypothetical protein
VLPLIEEQETRGITLTLVPGRIATLYCYQYDSMCFATKCLLVSVQ